MNEIAIPASKPRVDSVDALRGFTILLMVFVNDLGAAAPGWMKHIQPPDADGMTLADIVFPAFLYIVGISIPLAIEGARARGASLRQLIGHIGFRSFALLLMGVMMVNSDADTRLQNPWWSLLAYLANVFAWVVVPKAPGWRRNVLLTLRALGVVGLVVLLSIFQRDPVNTQLLLHGPVENWTWLQTSWWGILGLIGWAYLVVSLLYLLLGQRREWLVGAMALLMMMFLVMQDGGPFARVADKPWLGWLAPGLQLAEQVFQAVNALVSFQGTLGSLAAITMAGCIHGTTMAGPEALPTAQLRIRWAAVLATGLALAGLLSDTFAGINKIAGTPAWCFLCASLTCFVWIGLSLVMDVRGNTKWSFLVRPAGANPLLAYLLHPILIWTCAVTGFSMTLRGYTASEHAWIVVCGSFAMAIVVCCLTGLIARAGVRIRV